MVKQSRRSRSRRNKRGGNYPEAAMPQQQQAAMPQQQQAAMPEQQQQAAMPEQQQQQQQAAMPEQQQQHQQDSTPGFFGSVTNFFGTSKPAPGAPEAEKSWYNIFGGRRRTRSRKGRKGRKSRRYKK